MYNKTLEQDYKHMVYADFIVVASRIATAEATV